jgi:hypothetical protein
MLMWKNQKCPNLITLAINQNKIQVDDNATYLV